MAAKTKKEKARELYRNGLSVWEIAKVLDETPAKIVLWTEDLR